MLILRKSGLAFVLLLLFACMLQPLLQATAAPADGVYSVDYVIKKAEDESVSMANDYFEKPAQLTVSAGTASVRLQLNHSEWITEFQVPGGNARVISSDKTADTRIVEFTVKNVNEPVIAKIHVTVPSIDYDHDYTIRFVFDVGKVPEATAAATAVPAPNKPAATDKPAAAAAATDKPAATAAAATDKPAATAAAATNEPAATAAATNEPAATAAATNEPAATAAAATDAPEAMAPANTAAEAADSSEALAAPVEQPQPKSGKILLGSGAALLIAAAGYAVFRARKK